MEDKQRTSRSVRVEIASTCWRNQMISVRIHSIGAVLATAALIIIGGCADPSGPTASGAQRDASRAPWSGDPELARAISALRDTTDQYHDVAVALAAGYRPSAAGC